MITSLTGLRALHVEGNEAQLMPGPYLSGLRELCLDWNTLFGSHALLAAAATQVGGLDAVLRRPRTPPLASMELGLLPWGSTGRGPGEWCAEKMSPRWQGRKTAVVCYLTAAAVQAVCQRQPHRRGGRGSRRRAGRGGGLAGGLPAPGALCGRAGRRCVRVLGGD